MAIAPSSDEDAKSTLEYQQPTPEELMLEGTLEGEVVSLGMTKIAVEDFLLVNRGFQWINEFPFNR